MKCLYPQCHVRGGDGRDSGRTPAAGFTGQDRFTYSISDGKGGTAVGDVQVRVR